MGSGNDEKRIPIANIGLLGHVDHGKTTLTQALTGKFTDEHSEELKRGISIRLGYADLTIRKCPKCEGSKAYTTFKKCFYCGSETEIVKTVSLVDAPGHETLIATVLTATSILDGAILVIAANEPCPQPQTEEHLMALEIAGIKNIIVVQNKIDLVSKEQALENYKQIKEFLKGTIAENAPIIPISAQHNINIDVLLEAIDKYIKPKDRNENAELYMYVARSFDVNKPGTEINNLKGGVLGGAIVQGKIKEGQEIEIKPGIRIGDKYEEVITKVKKISQGGQFLKEGKAGGLLAIETELDPALTKADKMVGNVVGEVGKLPPTYNEIRLEIHLIKRKVAGVELQGISIREGDPILMNVGTARTVGICTKSGKISEFKLKLPICAKKEEKVVISKQVNGRWRLIGYGIIV